MKTPETFDSPSLLEFLGVGFSAYIAVAVMAIIAASVALGKTAPEGERFARYAGIQPAIGVGLWGVALAGAEWVNLQSNSMMVTLPDSGFDPRFIAFNEATHAARSMLAHLLLALTALLFVIANFPRRRPKSSA